MKVAWAGGWYLQYLGWSLATTTTSLSRVECCCWWAKAAALVLFHGRIIVVVSGLALGPLGFIRGYSCLLFLLLRLLLLLLLLSACSVSARCTLPNFDSNLRGVGLYSRPLGCRRISPRWYEGGGAILRAPLVRRPRADCHRLNDNWRTTNTLASKLQQPTALLLCARIYLRRVWNLWRDIACTWFSVCMPSVAAVCCCFDFNERAR